MNDEEEQYFPDWYVEEKPRGLNNIKNIRRVVSEEALERMTY